MVLGRWGLARQRTELKEAATHYERSAALCDAPAVKAQKASFADMCRSSASWAETM